MPSTSSRTTRSSAAIRFPSFKNALATTPKSSSSSSTSSKPDAITLLFRREVQSLLSTPPTLPSHIPANTPVEVVACVERLSLSGIQQSVQLCQAGEETWVTRTEGARQYFPRAGRVQKRLRGTEEMEQEDEEQMDEEVAVESPTRKKKSKKSHSSRQDLETPDNDRGRGIATSTSSTSKRNILAAPEKKKKHRKSRQALSGDGGNSDDGASTETEQSYLGRTRSGRSPAMLTSIGEEGEDAAHLGRGQRRCIGRRTPQASTSEGEGLVKVKHEESDDLASLCGGVGGLEFRSTVDPESECEGSSVVDDQDRKGKGKARA